LRQGVSFTQTRYGGVLLDEKEGVFWRLNPTAAAVISAITSGAEPVTAVAEKFDVTADNAATDIDELITELRNAGLLR
ncbi:MAG: lasso peptide biosynthesis PqqD family chaperone, partial [Mycobacterium sp.]|nr:lasso peptide biosynthesis PqqD family chaperone [Mycobacterium sp.]